MAVILGMTAIGAWAIMTDRISYVVTHGVSMNPVYYQNDLVFVVKADSYQIGEIAAYHGSGAHPEILHRIIGGNAQDGYVLKGDNNQSTDSVKPKADKMIGRAVLHIPQGGVWLKPLLSPTGLGMFSFLLASSGAAAPSNRREIPRGRRKKKVKAMTRQGGPWTKVVGLATAFRRLPTGLAAAVVAVTVLGTAGVILAALAVIKPSSGNKSAQTATQTMTFSYSATVPKSPAYDGTTVRSPDPIFRKLTNLVDLHFEYHGRPGVFDATAVMATSNGWHTSINLVSQRQFTGSTYTAKVPLRLDDLEERGNAAAKAIGLDPGTLTIDVTSRVVNGSHTFSAPFPISVTPLVMTVGTGGTWQHTEREATAQNAGPKYIGLFGRDIMPVTIARNWAVLLLLVAASGVIAIFLIGRRQAPLRTRTEIERRHPQLLVHVEPMPSPPGKPVVNVDNFPALVKLAERYGQMILTWRRPEADDFVVRDEGITYRYRIPLDEPTLQNIELINRPGAAGSHRRKPSSSQVS